MNFNVNVKQQKNELRKKYREERRRIPREQKLLRDAEIVRQAKELASFRYAEYVLLYASSEGEICLDDLACEALSLGKKVAFPVCNTESFSMEYRFVNSIDELCEGSYGIREPSALAPVFDPKCLTGSAVCFVPGLVFDTGGYRVGYGKGYFDRFLSSFSGSRIGVVYNDFIVEKVPRGRFDIKVDILLTEKNVKVTREN